MISPQWKNSTNFSSNENFCFIISFFVLHNNSEWELLNFDGRKTWEEFLNIEWEIFLFFPVQGFSMKVWILGNLVEGFLKNFQFSWGILSENFSCDFGFLGFFGFVFLWLKRAVCVVENLRDFNLEFLFWTDFFLLKKNWIFHSKFDFLA